VSSGNPILDAFDGLTRRIEGLAGEVASLRKALSAGDPAAVRRAAEEGARAGAVYAGDAAAAEMQRAARDARIAASAASEASERIGRGIPRPLAVVALLGLLASHGAMVWAGWTLHGVYGDDLLPPAVLPASPAPSSGGAWPTAPSPADLLPPRPPPAAASAPAPDLPAPFEISVQRGEGRVAFWERLRRSAPGTLPPGHEWIPYEITEGAAGRLDRNAQNPGDRFLVRAAPFQPAQ
jgi:hypothetical protein